MGKRRLYDRVSQKIAKEIVTGGYAIGDRMPSERELALKYQVSRPTIREAVIALEVDGLLEVVKGSGVYVRALSKSRNGGAPSGIGPFELLEARIILEGEAAALAARHITEAELVELEVLVDEMAIENNRNILASEDADERFHIAIARATNNSAMEYMVETLWRARANSPQTAYFDSKIRQEGITPRVEEHAAIVDALRSGSSEAARMAMQNHLRRVVDSILLATESDALEQARKGAESARERYAFEGLR